MHGGGDNRRRRQRAELRCDDESPQQGRADHLEEPLLPHLDEQRRHGQVSAAQQPEVSRNVRLTLAFTFCAFVGRSIWQQSVLATFVYLLRHDDPEAVGFITAVMGISQLITSFPAGFLADRYRRDALLKLASLFGVAAVAVTLLACRNRHFVSLVLALSSWGCFWGT